MGHDGLGLHRDDSSRLTMLPLLHHMGFLEIAAASLGLPTRSLTRGGEVLPGAGEAVTPRAENKI